MWLCYKNFVFEKMFDKHSENVIHQIIPKFFCILVMFESLILSFCCLKQKWHKNIELLPSSIVLLISRWLLCNLFNIFYLISFGVTTSWFFNIKASYETRSFLYCAWCFKFWFIILLSVDMFCVFSVNLFFLEWR